MLTGGHRRRTVYPCREFACVVVVILGWQAGSWSAGLSASRTTLDIGPGAELIRNGSFEESPARPQGWIPVGGAHIVLDTSAPVIAKNPHALSLRGSAHSGGVANRDDRGVPVEAGRKYRVDLYVRWPYQDWEGAIPRLFIGLETGAGAPLSKQVSLTDHGPTWKRFTGTLRASRSDPAGRLVIRITAYATALLDNVSLTLAGPGPNGMERPRR